MQANLDYFRKNIYENLIVHPAKKIGFIFIQECLKYLRQLRQLYCDLT